MDEYLSLDEAAKLIPGANAESLRRLARKGLLTVYRPGKPYLTTRADLERCIVACRVVPTEAALIEPSIALQTARAVISRRTPRPSAQEQQAASEALDAALAALRGNKAKTALAEWKAKRASNR